MVLHLGTVRRSGRSEIRDVVVLRIDQRVEIVTSCLASNRTAAKYARPIGM